MTQHMQDQHEHPDLVISLRTRSRVFGTLNLALAIRGRSCGWGTCDHPRRAFFGRVRRAKPARGLHFAELVVLRNQMRDESMVFRFGDNRASHPRDIR